MENEKLNNALQCRELEVLDHIITLITHDEKFIGWYIDYKYDEDFTELLKFEFWEYGATDEIVENYWPSGEPDDIIEVKNEYLIQEIRDYLKKYYINN